MRFTSALFSAPLLASVAFVCGCPDEVLVSNPGGVAGMVCNPITGRPAAGASVSTTFDTEGIGEQTKEVSTNDDGTFELDGITEGKRTLIVKADDFEDKIDVDIVGGAQPTLLQNPACRDVPVAPGTGTLVGQICNRHIGDILKDAQIVLTYSDGTVVDTNRTDPETGRFTIEEVPTGTVVVSVIGVSFRKTYVVEVTDGDIITVEEAVGCGAGELLDTGFLTGDLCDPETLGPLIGAEVTASWQDGETDFVEEVGTVTDENGHFLLDSLDPDDNITVRVLDDRGFAFTWQVRAGENGGPLQDRTVMPDGINLTADQECQPLLPDDGRRYLVVEGIYDRIEDALVRNGITPEIEPFPTSLDDWANNLFSNQERVSSYDVIFINCGAEDHELAIGLSAAAKTGLRRYVEQGGALYVSDWSYEFVEAVFPEKIDFFGPDDTFDAAQQAVGGRYNAKVLDDDLRDSLGLDEFPISFSFQAGSIISQVADGVRVYLETDMKYVHDGREDILPNTPVTVGFDAGLGQVIFTSFHQETNPEDGTTETLQGPEDDVLQYLIFAL